MTPPAPPWQPSARELALWAVAAIAFRFLALGQEPFWIDEVFTLRAVRGPFWHHLATVESTPPLSFALIKAWSLAFGMSHEALRAFSAVAGGLAVPALVWSAARWKFPADTARTAGVLLSLHPFAFWASQQNRYYGLFLLFAALWIGAVAALLEERPRRIRWPLVLAALGGFATHYYFAFLIVATGLFLLGWWAAVRRDRATFAMLAANGASVAAACATMLPMLLVQTRNAPSAHLQAPPLELLGHVFTKYFLYGPQFDPGSETWRHAALAALALLAAAAFARPAARTPAVVFLAAVALGGPAISFAFSRLAVPLFQADRYPMVFLPAYVLLATALWGALPRPRVALAAGGAVWIACMAPTLRHYIAEVHDFDWRRAIRTVAEQRRDGDALVFCPDWLRGSFDDNGGIADPAVSAHDFAAIDAAPRVWAFVWSNAPESSGAPGLNRRLAARRARTILSTPIISLQLAENPPP